ncbi:MULTISPECIES: ABC transporter substrate-binding protein [Mesorhizobium]|uniref:ABC transporter substrate-binding protein n=1 Tax=Mesorhizobium TaxID=68287 RepID=UPI0010A96AD8|nr:MULTISPECIES: ABC transporter substrate-binding protein [Mesorhizobium]
MKSLLRTSVAAVVALTLTTFSAAAENVLKWGAQRDVVSLDPYSYGDTFTIAVLNHVYEGLVRYDEKLQIAPALATSWEVVSPTVWRFHLRKGVKFHNGAPFTADDVIASLIRVSDPASPLRGNLPAYKGATKVDDYTVEINTTPNYPLLLNDLTNIVIFDKEWLVANHAEAPTDVGKGVEGYATSHANGTGPFKILSRKPDAETVFEVNKDWWDKPKHNIDKIIFTPITSSATRVAALLSGEIDFTNSAPLQDIPRLQASPDIKVLASNELRTVFFLFNRTDKTIASDITDKNPMNDIKVRQAMYQSIDIDALQKKVMRGLSRNTGSLIAPAIPGYVDALDSRLPYDPDAAKKLLAEAGYPNGFSFSFVCENDGYVNEEEICQAVSSMWARVGLKANLDVAPTSLQTAKFESGKFDVGILGWANEPMIDSFSILVQVVHSKIDTSGVFNWGGWKYPEVDALIDSAGKELDREKRLGFQTQALTKVKDDIAFLPLHQQPMAWAMGPKIESIVQLTDNKPRFWLTMMK